MMPADKTLSCPECESGPVANLRSAAATSSACWGGRRRGRRRRVDAAAEGPRRPRREAARSGSAGVRAVQVDGRRPEEEAGPAVGLQGGEQPLPARLMTANAPVGKSVIGLEYDRKQVEILDKIFRVDQQRRRGLQATQPQRQASTTAATSRTSVR